MRDTRLFQKNPNFWTSSDQKHTSSIDRFQVATNARGRGVLRLILRQQQIALLGIPVICAHLLLLMFPTWKAPPLFCVCFHALDVSLLMNRYITNFAIAVGR